MVIRQLRLHLAVLLDADALPVVVHALQPLSAKGVEREVRLAVGDAGVVAIKRRRTLFSDLLEDLVVEVDEMIGRNHGEITNYE